MMRIQRTGFGVAFLLLALATFIGLQSQNARAETTDHAPAVQTTGEHEEAPAHEAAAEQEADPAHPAESSDHAEAGDHGASDEHANDHHSLHLDGSTVSVLWCIPFIGILLSIAILPLVAARFWHHHYGKVSLFWGLAFFVPFSYANGIEMGLFYLSEVYLGEFIPFIVLLLALFTVSPPGGLEFRGLKASDACQELGVRSHVPELEQSVVIRDRNGL